MKEKLKVKECQIVFTNKCTSVWIHTAAFYDAIVIVLWKNTDRQHGIGRGKPNLSHHCCAIYTIYIYIYNSDNRDNGQTDRLKSFKWCDLQKQTHKTTTKQKTKSCECKLIFVYESIATFCLTLVWNVYKYFFFTTFITSFFGIHFQNRLFFLVVLCVVFELLYWKDGWTMLSVMSGFVIKRVYAQKWVFFYLINIINDEN